MSFWGFRADIGRLVARLAHLIGGSKYFGTTAHINGSGPCERCVGMSVQGAEEL